MIAVDKFFFIAIFGFDPLYKQKRRHKKNLLCLLFEVINRCL